MPKVTALQDRGPVRGRTHQAGAGDTRVAQLELSRAIRSDLLRHMSAGRGSRVSYAIPDDLRIDSTDVDAARIVVRELVGFLLDAGFVPDGGLLSVEEQRVSGVDGVALLVCSGSGDIDDEALHPRFGAVRDLARELGGSAALHGGDRDALMVVLRLP